MSLFATLMTMWGVCLCAAAGSMHMLRRAKRSPNCTNEEPLRNGRQRLVLFGAVGLWMVTVLASAVSFVAVMMPGDAPGYLPLTVTLVLWGLFQVSSIIAGKQHLQQRHDPARARMIKAWFLESTVPANFAIAVALMAVAIGG